MQGLHCLLAECSIKSFIISNEIMLHIQQGSYRQDCVKFKDFLCKTATLKKRINFQDQSLNAGQNYCRMLQGEHSTILSTFLKLPFVIKIFVLSIFELRFYTCFTVHVN